MYSFSFSERSNDFDEYYLEVQNNAIHSYGADYAIDGLRIYRSIPKIDVKRVDVCSSASLTVATDYELLLKNMGWSINPDVLSDLNMGGWNNGRFKAYMEIPLWFDGWRSNEKK